MRVVKNSIIFISFFMATDMFSSDPVKQVLLESSECLEIVGIAVNEDNEPLDGVEVKLFKENEEMEWVEITNTSYHDHNFTFKLDANQYYTIEIFKEGYVKRSVVVSTKIPKNVDLRVVFKYGFEVVLFKEKRWMDDFCLDFPVALISYNEKSEVFENQIIYTKHIKSKMKETEINKETVRN